MSRILVVDDSRTQATRLAESLLAVGYQVDVLANSTDVISQLRAGRYDLLLCDVVMPCISGYDLCRTIKNDPELCRLPVILLTTLRATGDIMEGLSAGADCFVIKPYDSGRLLARVAYALATARLHVPIGDRDVENIEFEGKRYRVGASRQQMAEFLLSTLEDYRYVQLRERDAAQAATMRLHSKSRQLDRANQELEQQRQLGRELVQARDRAKAESVAKSRFVATIGHELRTALNGIVGAVELLSASELGDQDRQYVQLLGTLSQGMVRLVSDILDLSKLEADRLDSEKIAFALHDLMQQLHMTFAQQAVHKGVGFAIDIDSEVPARVVGEQQHLQQVLMNLCSNALKFTYRGSITVRVRLIERRVRRWLMQFDIIDTGIGIPQERLPNIFEPYTQADASTTRAFGGTGLGLPISRRLVEFMGGELMVESRPNAGSRFWFQLELGEVTADVRAPSPRLARGTGPQPSQAALTSAVCQGGEPSARLLLVDDNPINRCIGKSIIERLGYTCDVAGNGHEAVEAFDAGNYDLVLMDCLMPVMDGYDATSVIRSRESASHHTPIIALTAALEHEERQHCLNVGMDSVIGKPLDLGRLKQLLHAYLRQRA